VSFKVGIMKSLSGYAELLKGYENPNINYMRQFAQGEITINDLFKFVYGLNGKDENGRPAPMSVYKADKIAIFMNESFKYNGHPDKIAKKGEQFTLSMLNEAIIHRFPWEKVNVRIYLKDSELDMKKREEIWKEAETLIA